MRSHLANRLRSSSLSAVPPPPNSADYSTTLATVAASILFRSPLPSADGLPIYILNAAALPDAAEIDFDALLPYVLARLPEEDELLNGTEYEVIFFAGAGGDGPAAQKKSRPGWAWFIQAYHVLSRAMRKRLQKLYIVHERSWVRVLVEMFSTIVSPKFRRKIVHVSTLSNLAMYIPIENILIPPSAYLHDRRLCSEIDAPYVSGRRAFSARQPLPRNSKGETRLPRVLRETTRFILMGENINTEGLFRVPGHSRLRDVLREAYDRGQKFIIWKDGTTTLPTPDFGAGEIYQHIVDEIDPRDAYNVYLAAGLLKSWYSSLRQPLFPQSCYRDLRQMYGHPEKPPDLEGLTELLSPKSEWSILPEISRQILVRHLLPLLSLVAANSDHNKMNAENLAVCFAPSLLCGPDQLEDAKVSSVIRRLLKLAIEKWSQGLRERCGVSEQTFWEDLEGPKELADYEDPLEDHRRISRHDTVPITDDHQFTGIIMQDNEREPEKAPLLPPRPPKNNSRPPSSNASDESATRRKPAPPLIVPPRYSSTLPPPGPGEATESPLSKAATSDGFSAQAGVAKAGHLAEERINQSEGAAIVPSLPIVPPKRKALTAEQIGNADNIPATAPAAKGTTDIKTTHVAMSNEFLAEMIKRKPVQSPVERPVLSPVERPAPISTEKSTYSPAEPSPRSFGYDGASEKDTAPAPVLTKPEQSDKASFSSRPTTAPESANRTSLARSASTSEGTKEPVSVFRRPSWAASANRNLTGLARPLPAGPPVPPVPAAYASQVNRTAPAPRLRAPSASLMSRMPSFEQKGGEKTPSPRLEPQKLNLKKQSVDDLRRLYEERAGTAKKLVEAGVSRRTSRASSRAA